MENTVKSVFDYLNTWVELIENQEEIESDCNIVMDSPTDLTVTCNNKNNLINFVCKLIEEFEKEGINFEVEKD